MTRWLFAAGLAISAATLGHADSTGEARIVSLAPHLTELAFAAGIGERLVGAVAYSDFPEAARELPRIGDAFRFDIEGIVRLRATHALAWRRGTPRQAVSELENLGLRVVTISTGSLEEIGAALERLGALAGNAEQGRRAANRFRERVAGFEAEAPSGDALGVFYQVSAQPLFTLGRGHVINEALSLCGARNAFEDLDGAAASIDFEAVLERDPWAIVAGRTDAESDPLQEWRRYPALRAVRCDRLLAVDPALLVRPTPRLLDGVERLCAWMEERIRRAEDPACRNARE